MKHSEVAKILNEFGFCGCGAPYGVLNKIKEVMNIIGERRILFDEIVSKEEQDRIYRETYDKLEKCLHINKEDDDSSFYYLMLYLLDKLKLTEHGTSIRGCWLTRLGEEFLKELNENTTEEIFDFDEFEEENEDNDIKKVNINKVGIMRVD